MPNYLDLITKNTEDRKKLTLPPKATGLENLYYLDPQESDGVGRLQFAENGMKSTKKPSNVSDPFQITVPESFAPNQIDVSGMSKKERKKLSALMAGMQPEKEAPLKMESWVTDEDVWNGKGGTKSAGAGESVDNQFGLTMGDWMGMISTAAGGITQLMNTISNAKATKPNVNRFIGYNEKALRTNKKAQMQAGLNKATAKRATDRELQLQSNTAKSRNNKTFGGISQLAAANLATDLGINEAGIQANNQLEDIYGKQMLQLLGEEANLYTQQDQAVMSAAERKDEKDQQDLDNKYTQIATNLATLTESGQKLGYDFNQAQYRRDFLSILPETNPWGVGVRYDNKYRNPSLYVKNRSTKVTAQPVEPTFNWWDDTEIFDINDYLT